MSRGPGRRQSARKKTAEDRGLWGPLIGLIRVLRRWSQTRFARKAGMSKSQLSRYEAGAEVPRPETRERLLRAAAFPRHLVAPVRSFLRLLLRALRREARLEPVAWGDLRPPEAAQRAAWGIVERAVTFARLELAVRWSIRTVGKPAPPTAAERARAEALCNLLTSFEPEKRPLLVEGSQAYRDWLVCLLLCDRSERAAAHSADEALELARLARLVARRLPPDAFRPRLEGWAEHLVANALRVGNRLDEADAAFGRAERLWKSGTDEAGLLDEGRLLDLKASLRRAQRRFGEAMRLHDQALQAARPERTGHFLLNKGFTLEEKGDYEASIEVLEQAAREIDGERQPRLLCVQRFNLAANLVRLNRAAEAEPLVVEVRELTRRLGNDTDLIRTTWLEGLVLAGTGRLEEAVAALAQVRRDFELRDLPYDYALASLDLALVYREQGRHDEVAELAVEMARLFEAAGVPRETLAAVILFREAAEKREITKEMVKRLQESLKRARREPGVRFGSV
jgi:tetratricopeptide (TPR) repeat protein/DNA-binding transcriptional regulator YiaG